MSPICYAASEPTVGLEMRTDAVSLKCYLGDAGLLVSMAFDPVVMEKGVHERILHDWLSLDKGMLMENVVAQMIRASGRGLYFYSDADRILFWRLIMSATKPQHSTRSRPKWRSRISREKNLYEPRT